MPKLEGVALAVVIGAVPTFSMSVCSLIANRVKVKPEIEAIFQNFAAGLIISAVAAELFPLLSKNPGDGTDLPRGVQIGGLTIGFAVALCLIYGLEHFISIMEEEDEEEAHVELTSADGFHDGVELTNTSKAKNEDFYKKIADAQGVELDVASLGSAGTPVKTRTKSGDSSEDSPTQAPAKNSLESAEMGEGGSVAVVIKDEEGEDKVGDSVGAAAWRGEQAVCDESVWCEWLLTPLLLRPSRAGG
jgi:hypothetical protein